jgi:hypothetical protein
MISEIFLGGIFLAGSLAVSAVAAVAAMVL